MANTKDVYLDARGNVTTPERAVVMRRTVLDDDGRLLETSTWYPVGAEPQPATPKPQPKRTGWTPARGV